MAGTKNDVVVGKNADFSQINAPNATTSEANGLATNGQLWIGTTAVNAGGTHINVGALTSPDNSIAFGYSSPNITASAGSSMGTVKTITPNEDFDGSAATPISGSSGNINAFGVNPSFATVTETLNSTGASTGNLQVEHRAWVSGLVVDTSTTPGSRGTYSTLAAAMAAAVSGQTIFLRTSVTENVTITPGVNISAWSGGTLNTPTIIGTLTMTGAGTSNISGIRLQTNSAALLAVTGSAATIVNLNNCYLNCSNNTGITFSAASTSAKINIQNCQGDLGTTGIGLFAHSSTGNLVINNSFFTNSGSSVTASTASAGSLNISYSFIPFAITTSSTNSLVARESEFDMAVLNTKPLILGGSGVQTLIGGFVAGGSATALTATSALTNLIGTSVGTSNAAAIDGAGTLTGNVIPFTSTGSIVTTTTQLPLEFGIAADWVPDLQINGSSTGITYTTQDGRYVKLGNMVFLWANILLSNKGASVGALTISNMPYAPVSDGARKAIAIAEYNQWTAVGYTQMDMTLNNGTTVANLRKCGSAVAIATVLDTEITNTFQIKFSGFYMVT